jgi:hypothetical protein
MKSPRLEINYTKTESCCCLSFAINNKMTFLSLLVILFLLAFATKVVYGENNCWDIAVPTIEGGENIHTKRSYKFFTITKTYDITVESVDSVSKFYEDFFLSIGWENPIVESMIRKTDSQSYWSGRRMTFTNDGKPEAIYVNTWKAKGSPTKGVLELTLTNYSEEKKSFKGKIKVIISPEIDMSPLTKINQLIGENPKNLFHLYKVIKGNPLKIDTIEIPSSYQSSNDQLIKQYYNLVQEILNNYSDFRDKYCGQAPKNKTMMNK